jgi:hypothetical protein
MQCEVRIEKCNEPYNLKIIPPRVAAALGFNTLVCVPTKLFVVVVVAAIVAEEERRERAIKRTVHTSPEWRSVVSERMLIMRNMCLR